MKITVLELEFIVH